MSFIEKDNLKKNELMADAEREGQRRKKKEMKLKKLDTDIQNVKTDIDKNKDQLDALEKHREFLRNLSEKRDKQWVLEQERKRQ